MKTAKPTSHIQLVVRIDESPRTSVDSVLSISLSDRFVVSTCRKETVAHWFLCMCLPKQNIAQISYRVLRALEAVA